MVRENPSWDDIAEGAEQLLEIAEALLELEPEDEDLREVKHHLMSVCTIANLRKLGVAVSEIPPRQIVS